MLLYWVFLQFVSGVFSAGGGQGGGVAFMAHVGGFVSGAALIRLFARPESVYRHRLPPFVAGAPPDRF
jgi:membrane associated rhomboid family serine protease